MFLTASGPISDIIASSYINAAGLIIVAIIGVIGLPLYNRLQKRRQAATEFRLSQQVELVKKALQEGQQDTKLAITNEHKVHLRDDIDSQFAEIKEGIAGVAATQEQQSSQINSLFSQNKASLVREKKRDRVVASLGKGLIGVRTDVATLFDNDAEHTSDSEELRRAVEDLEKTTPKSALPKQ